MIVGARKEKFNVVEIDGIKVALQDHDAESQAMGRTETELAFHLADSYISIQEVTDWQDYSIYDMDYRELDSGVYDHPDITIWQALGEIVDDLKEPTHRSNLEGNIRVDSTMIAETLVFAVVFIFGRKIDYD